MDQIMGSPFIEEARRACTRRRCGLCRIYPGNGEVCEGRGRAVSPLSRPCRVYDPMSPTEYAKLKEEMAEKQRAYRLTHKEELAEKKRAYYLTHKEEMA